MSERELALRIGETPQNLNNKMKRDDFKISELRKITEALGYRMEIRFVDTVTVEIVQ